MELICRILDQTPLLQRQYADPQTGQQKTFATVGLTVASGVDTLYIEAVQETAHQLPQLPRDRYYKCAFTARARPWQTQQGEARTENRLTLTRINEL